MKVKPVIAALLGCLIMVIMGHNIFPHHHHSGALNSHSGCEPPEACDHSLNHENDSNEPSQHCHAFNGLEYVVSFDKQADKQTLTVGSIVCLFSALYMDEPLPREVFYRCNSGPPPKFSGFLGESSGLRAPPVVS